MFKNVFAVVLVTKLYPTLHPMDCSPPGSSIHGTVQARMEWDAISFSKGSSQPRDQTASPALQADFLLLSHQGSPKNMFSYHKLLG